MSDLDNHLGLFLLLIAVSSAVGSTKATKESSKTDFMVNLVHALKVGLGSALRSEDDVHLLQTQALCK